MTRSISVSRTVKLPDQERINRIHRAPELGPHILFFSGGTALRPLSRALKHYTHNSIHLITPFDSGGSSAQLRKAFDMLSVGDLRNRLVALADESLRGNPEIYSLFCHRLALDTDPVALRRELDSMISGTHSLVSAVPEPMQRIVRTHLRYFSEHCSAEFELRGANIGNLLLVGAYLMNERDILSVLFMFSQLLEVRGSVQPIADTNLHLGVTLEDGGEIIGQHLFTGKGAPSIPSPVRELFLTSGLSAAQRATASISPTVAQLIGKAELICYPFGSFYSSVIANLLPQGVGQSLSAVHCPKVYIANPGTDPEQLGMTLSSSVNSLIHYVRRDAPEASVEDIVNLVLLDTKHLSYAVELDIAQVERLGVRVIDVTLTGGERSTRPDPNRLAEILLSLS